MSIQIEEYEPVDSIVQASDDLLQATVDSLASHGREVPDRVYQSIGNVAYDCEQLTVTLIQAYYGPPGDQAQEPTLCLDNFPRTGLFQIELVRCIPVGNSNAKRRETGPEAAEMTEASKELMRDVWAVLDAPTFVGNLHSVIGDISITEPQGAYVGIVLNITISL